MFGKRVIPFEAFPWIRIKTGVGLGTGQDRKEGKHIFRSEICVGNLDYLLRSSKDFENFPFGDTKIALPFTFQPKLSKLLDKW